jgi:ergothioneine biosynthesis protein EgtB
MTPFEAPGIPLPALPTAARVPDVENANQPLLFFFCSVRRQSIDLCRPLTPEDMMVQSCPEASPAKWHLAHTTWFFETFILREFLPGYQVFHPDFFWLFNSYYNSLSAQPEKKLRASFSRPDVPSILAYRRHVEEAITRFVGLGMPEEARRRLVMGLHHEQQHQELLCYDIKNAFWSNPLHPAYVEGDEPLRIETALQPLGFVNYEGGLFDVGYSGDDFSFDIEGPRHAEFVQPFQLGSRLITCGEYLAFMEDGGYERADLWLNQGWELVKAEGWKSPLYWHREGNAEWNIFTLRGNATVSALSATPVCHVSYYEADAFAHWSGKRLPTEAEWEVAAEKDAVSPLARGCNFLESTVLHPLAASGHAGGSAPQQLFGDVWEWTRSPFIGYPGYKPLPGALGEYNGKFMSNQMVLRGGSAVTPASHIRTTYRNFFSPATRWQFAGIRLADDLPAAL